MKSLSMTPITLEIIHTYDKSSGCI